MEEEKVEKEKKIYEIAEYYIKSKTIAIINNPTDWQKKDVKYKMDMFITSRYSSIKGEKISFTDMRELIDNYIYDLLDNLDIKKENLSDTEFLFLLGKKRNWKSGCAICLVDDIKGTTCGCGHTEIVVFRPCGHCMCGRPCFIEYINSKNIELKKKTFKFGNQTFYIEEPDYKYDNLNISCPICNGNISSTFQTENVPFNDLFDYKKIIEKISDKLNK